MSNETFYDGIRVYDDGDFRCAVFDDFIDIHESPCGFGHHDIEAIVELAKCVRSDSVKCIGELQSRIFKIRKEISND